MDSKVGDQWKMAQAIEKKPVEPPFYTSTVGKSELRWYEENETELRRYWRDICEADPWTEAEFQSWADCQYDVTCMYDEDFPERLGEEY